MADAVALTDSLPMRVVGRKDMRRGAVVLAAALLASTAAVCLAQGTAGRQRPAARSEAGDRILAGLEGLRLTNEQRTKIEKIRSETNKKAQEIRASSLAPAERREKLAALMRESREKIAAVLTPEQRARFLAESGRGEGRIPRFERLAESLSLTPQQRARLKPIVDYYTAQVRRLRERMPAGPEREQRVRAVVQEFRQRTQAVLTVEQRRRFEQMMTRGIGILGPLGNVDALAARLRLTGEQRRKVAAVVEKARDEAAKLREQARASGLTREQLRPKVQALRERVAGQIRPILTEQQRKQLDDMLTAMRQRAAAQGEQRRTEGRARPTRPQRAGAAPR